MRPPQTGPSGQQKRKRQKTLWKDLFSRHKNFGEFRREKVLKGFMSGHNRVRSLPFAYCLFHFCTEFFIFHTKTIFGL
jgi:hypothetical protein